MSPLTVIPLPYGLRDVKIAVLAGETPGTSVDFPNARSLSFSEAESFEELRGDDGVVAVHGNGPTVDWELEGGGYSFEAMKALYGGQTITSSGTTPNQIKTMDKLDTDQRPYVKIEGQAISDSGGDFHVILWKARATGDLSGTLADGAFWLTGASGRAIALSSNRKIYTFTQNETAVAPT